MTATPKGHRSRIGGQFAEEAKPPAKPVLVYLPEPILERLDAYGRLNGTGRGRSITALLEGLLPTPDPSELPPRAQKELVQLQLVKRSDPLYKSFRARHYIPDRGLVGQQLQYLIFYAGKLVGVIGGSSAVFKNQSRDEYWNFSEDIDIKTRELNSVINNNIFRLEYPAPNLASIVLKKWRKQIQQDWEKLYGVVVAGFETFIVEERLWNGKTRNGGCYRADNWDLIGITRGYGNTNVRGREHKNKILQAKKLVYCRRIKGQELCTNYTTSWNDKDRQKELSARRNQMYGDPLDLLLKTIVQ